MAAPDFFDEASLYLSKVYNRIMTANDNGLGNCISETYQKLYLILRNNYTTSGARKQKLPRERSKALMWSKLKPLKFLAALFLLITIMVLIVSTVAAQEEEPGPDHSEFFEGETFETASEVTAKCLMCHQDAAQEVMETTHWTWEHTTESGEQYGKNNVVNNYCVAVDSNWPRCTSCHTGYGYANDQYDFSVEVNVDCLACHADRTIYSKYPLAAGHPVYEGQELDWPKGSGNFLPPVDLVAAASSAGSPTRANCGSCHFNGGGAPGVKHGDLDPSMVNPSYELDVHMSPDGGDFVCQTCHTGGHDIAGSHYEYDLEGESGLMTCITCHSQEPHEDENTNQHASFVACQTCHIPTFAREFPTKTYWSWENAGDKETGVVKEEVGGVEIEVYNFKKGEFVWETDLTPTYMWFDGEMDWATVGEELDSSEVIKLAAPTAVMDSDSAKIFPFKEMRGRQAFDAGNDMMVVPFLFPNGEFAADAYWKSWDWNLAAERGMQIAGLEFSGELAWVDTVMYWPLTHQVAPASEALDCTACHSETSILDFAALGFSEDETARLSTVPTVDESVEDVAEETEPGQSETVTNGEEAAPEEESGISSVLIFVVIVILVLVIGSFGLRLRKQS
jgi:octaheme c-type cytochrome (tetrathionate reductase family)